MHRVAQRVEELRAADIMSTPAIACRPETFFEEVAELLADREISGMPVVNGEGEVVGVISERDLAHALGGPLMRLVLRRPVRSGPFLREPVPRGGNRAQDFMTAPAMFAHPETPVHTLAEIMFKEQLNRIPIVRANRLVGVVTRGDVLAAVAGLFQGGVKRVQPPVVIGSGSRDAHLDIGN
ncbi:MAG: CBS domain-containing protein [Actinomycetota bacterium]